VETVKGILNAERVGKSQHDQTWVVDGGGLMQTKQVIQHGGIEGWGKEKHM